MAKSPLFATGLPCWRRRQWLQFAVGALLASGAKTPLLTASAAPPLKERAQGQATSELVQQAQGFISSLDSQQRERAVLALENRWRDAWHYTPRRRPGLPLGEMSERQRSRCWELLAAALSAQGVQRARDVIKTEAILADLTGNYRFRDPDNYALVIFGQPAANGSWRLRFEGHHLSLTLHHYDDGSLQLTPLFLGANPAIAPQRHRHRGFEALRQERELAFALIQGLSPALQQQVMIADRSLGDIVAGPGREESLRRYRGVAATALPEPQRQQALALVELYLNNAVASLATRQRQALAAAGLDQLYFAWAGSKALGSPHYFRLHGPTLLIEYDNTQNGGNHIHSVLHDRLSHPVEDPLARHYRHHHQRLG